MQTDFKLLILLESLPLNESRRELAEDLMSVVGTSRQYQFRIGCRPSPKLGTQQKDRGSCPVPRRPGADSFVGEIFIRK